jgi:hypothetical protein
MAQAQLIQGTGAELIEHLENRRDQKNLLLIIPEQEISAQNAVPATGEPAGRSPLTVLRNGVPLLPTQGAAQTVTMEQVKLLAEEE